MNKAQAKVHASRHGFQYTLPNGYRLSVMFGVGNYSENKGTWHHDADAETVISSSNFEVAVFTPDDKFLDLIDETDEDGDRRCEQVIGWVPAWTLPRLISRVSYFPEYRLGLHDQLRAYALGFGEFCEDAKDAVHEDSKETV